MTPDKLQLQSLGKTPSKNNLVETATPNWPINAILEAPSSSENESPGSINSIMGSDVETNSSPELLLEGRGNTFNRDQPGRLEVIEQRIRDGLVFHDEKLKTELQRVNEELLNLKTYLQSVTEELLNTRTKLKSVTEELLNLKAKIDSVSEEQLNLRTELESVTDEQFKVSVSR